MREVRESCMSVLLGSRTSPGLAREEGPPGLVLRLRNLPQEHLELLSTCQFGICVYVKLRFRFLADHDVGTRMKCYPVSALSHGRIPRHTNNKG